MRSGSVSRFPERGTDSVNDLKKKEVWVLDKKGEWGMAGRSV